MALPIRAVNMVKVGRVCSRMLSSGILYGHNKPQAEELQLLTALLDGELASFLSYLSGPRSLLRDHGLGQLWVEPGWGS